VGTSHSIQLGIGVSGEVTGKFRAFLERVCLTQGVCAVAEEMNAEALAERNCSSSIPQQLAASLNLQHRFCDPNRCERAIRAKALLSDLPEAEISSRVAESYQKREQYWLGHLRALNCWPVLFVCGADHVV